MANVCLIVIDGWGISNEKKGNAIANAQTPVMTQLSEKPGQYTELNASGLYVGLPKGLMGNSEVGHLNIGAGRVIYQDIVRINMSIEDKSLFTNEVFVDLCKRAKNGNGRLHLVGLVSDGGVHSHIDHLFALLEGAKVNGVKETFVQAITDGRDTLPSSGAGYIKQAEDFLKKLQYGQIATIVGRYYAMDRDKRYERVKIAYEGFVDGKGQKVKPEDLIKTIQGRYSGQGDEKQTDEFFKPIIVEGKDNRIQDNDTVLFFNYRSDRMREIVEAIGLKPQFETSVVPKNLGVYCMTEYKKEFKLPTLFAPVFNKNVLAEWISKKGLPQYHCAETEKYAHVTFFFNGGREEQFPMEERKMVPSPKVATYDLQPEMSCMGVAEAMVEAIKNGKYPFIMCNFAPPDMVGHTGVYEAAIKAVDATDKAIGMVLDACNKHSYTLLITSDHGNAEEMISSEGGPFTQHTCNLVPFMVTGFRKFKKLDKPPALCDVAPTVLDLMGLDKPPDMTGKSLLEPV